MQKARTRLRAATTVVEPTLVVTMQRKSLASSTYIRTLPFGLFGLVSLIAVLQLLFTVEPEQIANIPLPNAYGPLLALIFSTGFFVLGYALKNLRRGFLLTCAGVLLVFFRLQHVVLEIPLILGVLLAFVGLEILITLRHRSAKSDLV